MSEATGNDVLEFFGDPARPAKALLEGLLGPTELHVLQKLVTPESLPAWDDFLEARAQLRKVKSPGIGDLGNEARGAEDWVRYFPILDNVPDGGFSEDQESPVVVPLILTMIRHPASSRWLAHGLREDYFLIEELAEYAPHEGRL